MVDNEKPLAYSPAQKQKQIYNQGGDFTPPKYYISYFEWLVMRGLLILKNENATQTGKLIYEVPARKVFFLISCSLNSENVSGGGSFDSSIAVDEQAFSISTSTTILRISATDEITGATAFAVNKSISSSYSIPLKFIEGFKFYGYDNPSSQGNSECTIQGYEIDRELFEVI